MLSSELYKINRNWQWNKWSVYFPPRQHILVNFSPKHFDHIITTCALHTNKSLHHTTSNYILVYEAHLLQQTDEISTNLHALYRPSTESIKQTVCKIVIIHETLRTLLYAQPKWDAVEKQHSNWTNGSYHYCIPGKNLCWVCMYDINRTSNYYNLIWPQNSNS